MIERGKLVNDYSLDHIFSYTVQYNRPEFIGPVAEGVRANLYSSGGIVDGPRISGKIRPVGGNWLIVRTDGVVILDMRGTIETTDKARLYITYTGMGDFGEDGYQNFLGGELPNHILVHTAPRFHTAHPNYQWLNRFQCLGIGKIDFSSFEAMFDIYTVN